MAKTCSFVDELVPLTRGANILSTGLRIEYIPKGLAMPRTLQLDDYQIEDIQNVLAAFVDEQGTDHDCV